MQAIRQRATVICLAVAVAAMVQPARADEVADFYKSKGLTIVVSSEVGTGFDIYARALGRHLARHLPGNPGILIQNMTGASGLVGANWLYNVAPRDGSVMATFVNTVPFEPLRGNSAARYWPEKFAWIGNMEAMVSICGASRASGIGKFDDLFAKEALFGGTGVTGPIATHALALRHLFGAKVRVITGYKGTGSIKLAVERNEISGACIDMSTVTASWQEDYQSGAFKPILQISGGSRPDLAGVPNVNDLAMSDEDRRVIGLVYGTDILGRPFASTPGVPVERMKALRSAFTATMADPLFLADAAKAQIEISPMSGEEVQSYIGQVTSSPPAVVERAKQAIRND